MIPGYFVTNDKEKMDFETIYAFISKSYWASNIPRETFKKAILNSECFGVFTEAGEQVGFARLITDCATFAYLADVFILERHRGKGLSKWLMYEITESPNLQGLRRIALATLDAHGLYSQFGYTKLNNPEMFMEKWNPNVYKQA